MKTLKKIDKNIGKVKEKVTFICQVYNIIDSNKSIVILPDKDMPKKVKSYYTILLQNLSNLDTAISKV
jgi:hypothetical protein